MEKERSKYERVLEQTRDDYERFYAAHPLIAMTLSGGLERSAYVRYLTETYHIVKHAAQMLALGAARAGYERPDLRNWFCEQLEEERGHDLLLLKDWRHLGIPEEEVRRTMPGRGAWGLITQNYYMTTYGNPVGILGVASLTEGLGASMATCMADCLNTLCFDLTLQDEQWFMQAALDDEEAARFERILTSFIKQHNIAFPVHAWVGSAESMLPFKIRQVVYGSNASVVTQDGDRLYVGDEYRGVRLVAVAGDRLTFAGKRKIEVRW
jgi:hypothetical protein